MAIYVFFLKKTRRFIQFSLPTFFDWNSYYNSSFCHTKKGFLSERTTFSSCNYWSINPDDCFFSSFLFFLLLGKNRGRIWIWSWINWVPKYICFCVSSSTWWRDGYNFLFHICVDFFKRWEKQLINKFCGALVFGM